MRAVHFWCTPHAHLPIIAPIVNSQAVREATPLGRLGEPEDTAAAVAFLCMPASKFITGQVAAKRRDLGHFHTDFLISCWYHRCSLWMEGSRRRASRARASAVKGCRPKAPEFSGKTGARKLPEK